MFSLTIILLINSIHSTNADLLSSIDSFNEEGVKIILRALNHKCQVNWERDFRLNTPNRREKTRKVLEFLNAVYTEKKQKLDQEQLYYLTTFYTERQPTLDQEHITETFPAPGKAFRDERWKRKQAKLELGKGKLEGLLSNSERADFLTFECLSRQAITIEGIGGFVVLDDEENELISTEIKFEEPAFTLSEEQTTALDLFPSTPALASSSSTPPPILSASISASSISPPDDAIDEAEVLLSMLDEKSAKIALQARLNDYHIPFDVFHFSIPEETEKCTKVVNYLNLILERKIKRVFDKQTTFPPDHPGQQFYLEKHTQYLHIHDNMWNLFTQKMESPPSTPVGRTSIGRNDRMGRINRDRAGRVRLITRQY